jgi:hypothetical protein
MLRYAQSLICRRGFGKVWNGVGRARRLSAVPAPARWLAGVCKALAEDDAIDPGTPVVLDDCDPLGIRCALEMKA